MPVTSQCTSQHETKSINTHNVAKCTTRRHINITSNSGNPEGSRAVHKKTMRNDVGNQ